MEKCTICGKEFATKPQLTGHMIHCKRKAKDALEETQDGAPLKETNIKIKGDKAKLGDKVVMEEDEASIADPAEAGVEPVANYAKYKELPEPIVEHLEREIPNWLNKFEIGQEYKKDFGGYGMYIKVPQRYSTEYRVERNIQWDNRTRRAMLDDNGNEVVKKVVYPDVRWMPIKEMADVTNWIDRVIKHITTNARKKGLILPPTRI